MDRKWRTYSVFVSSTFADMQAERDYLETHVFPLINNDLRKHSIILRVIDLRSGINTLETGAESQEEKVLRICIDEINRSKPFFLAILGNQYGTIPSPEKVKNFSERDFGESITATEISYGFLQRTNIQGCLFLERNSACYEYIDGDTRYKYDDSVNPERQNEWNKLRQLKKQIKKRLSEDGKSSRYIEYSTRWDGTQMVDLDGFGKIVRESIMQEILSFFETEDTSTPCSDEQRTQDEFLFIHRTNVLTRERVLKELSLKLENNSGLLTIVGNSGQGKSCIYTQIVDLCIASPRYITLYHATDTGQENRSIQSMLSRWIFQLENELRVQHIECVTLDEQTTYFRHLIKSVPQNKKLILLIDSIEGFFHNNISEYLTFYPKTICKNVLLCCTCLPDAALKISSYHKSTEIYNLPSLVKYEAEGIIRAFFSGDNKEFYPIVIDNLLSKKSKFGFCYESPLWLSIALQFLTHLTQNDYREVSILAKQYNNSYDQGMIAYISKRIESFPDNEENLFANYLLALQTSFGHFPILIFKNLSVCYDGLDESIIALLLDKEWDIRTFGYVRSFLQSFIAEQGQLKNWKLMHKKVQLQLPEYEKLRLCSNIARIYMKKWREGNLVTDNICYYLVSANLPAEGFEYFNCAKHDEDRAIKEFIQTIDVVGVDKPINFLFNSYSHRKDDYHKYIPAALMLNFVKNVIMEVANDSLRMGNIERTIKVIDSFHSFLFSLHIPYDFKVVYYMLTVQIKLNATERVFDDKQQAIEYNAVLHTFKIRGPISLLLTPVARKYYKWQLFKLK